MQKSKLGTNLLNSYLYDFSSKEEFDDYGKLLANLAQFVQAKICVEIGVAHGATTKALCKYLKNSGGHVYGFDIWSKHGLVDQFENIGSKKMVTEMLEKNGLSNFTLTQIDVINDRSNFESKLDELLNNKKIDFAFIDADHSYIGIKNDFEVIYPRLSNQGIIAFHDSLMIDGSKDIFL